jgi:hypothetical protein
VGLPVSLAAPVRARPARAGCHPAPGVPRAAGHPGYWLVGAMAVAAMSGIINSWVLLVEIKR